MDAFTQINQHRYIYLLKIGEPEDNALKLLLAEARPDGPSEISNGGGVEIGDARLLTVANESSIYEVRFETYIAYSVRNEAFTAADSEEESEGRLMCIYSRSRFLEYVRASTFAADDYPGRYQHYGFNCLNHIVDVASIDQPQIIRVSEHT